MGDEELFAVKAGVSAEGANLEVRAGLTFPLFLARLFPRAAARRDATSLVTTTILEKIARHQALDASDVAYAKEVFSEAEAKWMRRQQIAAKALNALNALPKQALPPAEEPGAAESNGETNTAAEDWINKFWDDAGLVSDEMLQQIYARILVQESIAPGSCSMRTLRTLRYLDRDTANLFALIVPYVMDNMWIPNNDSLLKKYGVSYRNILELDEAGLADSNAQIARTFEGNRSFLRWGGRVLQVNKVNGLRFLAFVVRQPGRDLARVAEVERNPAYFFEVANWLKSMKPDVELSWAELPYPTWNGPAINLSWKLVPLNAPG